MIIWKPSANLIFEKLINDNFTIIKSIYYKNKNIFTLEIMSPLKHFESNYVN